MLARRRLDQACREIELSERRLHVLLEIGLQHLAPPGVLVFGPVCAPPLELGDEITAMKMPVRPGDCVGSAHVWFPGRSWISASVSRYTAGWKWAPQP